MLKDAVVNLSRLAKDGKWSLLYYVLRNKWYGIDLNFVSVKDLGLTDDKAKFYSDSGGPDLDIVVRALSISPSDEILDVGCGKGGAALTLARHRFRRADGIEISEHLVEIAKDNLRRAHIKKSTVFVADATQFTDLDRYTYLYMANPFTDLVLAPFMQNVIDSIRRRPRKVTLIYRFPVHENVVLESGFRKVREFLHSSHPFGIYEYGQ